MMLVLIGVACIARHAVTAADPSSPAWPVWAAWAALGTTATASFVCARRRHALQEAEHPVKTCVRVPPSS